MVARAVQRVVSVPLYWLIVGLATSFLSPILAIVISVHVNSNTIKETERAKAVAAAKVETAKQEATKEYLARTCRLLGAQVDVYTEAESEVGRNARAVWLREYQIDGCQPPRK